MTINLSSVTTAIISHPQIESRVVVSPAGRHDHSRYVLIIIRDTDGAEGYAEAATMPIWSGELPETACCAIETLFAPALCNRTLDHPSEGLVIMDGLAYGLPFTKSALDTALWDLWARKQNLPANRLFGDREPVTSIPTRASVGCYDESTTLRIATEFWRAGVRTLKFKVGSPGFDDVARLRTVREALGDEPRFTVDANGGYTSLREAVTAIQAFAPFNIELVEQPVPRERVHLMAAVRRETEPPILADESVFNCEELHDVLDNDACDIVGLYPGKNGGVSRMIEMAKLAAAAGKPCAIGNNQETDLGLAAMASVAAGLSAFPIEQIPCDLASSLYFCYSSITEPLILQDGRLPVPAGPGFGVVPLSANNQSNNQ